MTLLEFINKTRGVDFWQAFLNGKFIVGNALYSNMNKTITEFDFDADDNGRITCTVDLV